MPDWTYHPLRRPMGMLLGDRRSRRAAIGVVGALAQVAPGRWLITGLGHTAPPPGAATVVAGVPCSAAVGASVGLAAAADAVAAMPALGAGLIEIGPISSASVEQARGVLDRAWGPVMLRFEPGDAAAVKQAIGPHSRLVDLDGSGVMIRNATTAQVQRAAAPGTTIVATTDDPSPAAAAALIAAGAAMVLATTECLIEAGPGWFHRSTLAYMAARHDPTARREPALPWLAGVGLGLGMVAGGVGAAVVALGPVLLPYDQTFLGLSASDLALVNAHLIHFLQHDRITLAGTMVALGILYASLSWWGIREGRVWARNALLASCVVGFPTLFYFFAYQYVEPVHVALAAVLFPLFLIAVWRRPSGGAIVAEVGGTEDEWHRALAGQLLMVLVGAGLIAGGLLISYVGLTAVFVPSDLSYMETSAQALASANHRLLSFIAHDRAGFGGALISAGVAVLLLSAWGWSRGQAWVWWALAGGAIAGFGAALAVHLGVWYVDFWHLAPIYAGIVVTTIGLTLSWPYLMARSRVPERSAALSPR
jgi:hypothetical protein